MRTGTIAVLLGAGPSGSEKGRSWIHVLAPGSQCQKHELDLGHHFYPLLRLSSVLPLSFFAFSTRSPL